MAARTSMGDLKRIGGLFKSGGSKAWTGVKGATLGLGALTLGIVGLAALDSPDKRRRFHPDDIKTPEDPEPAVLGIPANPYPQEYASYSEPATLMNEPRVEGDMVRRVKARRGVAEAGIDTSPPSIVSPAGVNMIDGSTNGIRDLNDPMLRGSR